MAYVFQDTDGKILAYTRVYEEAESIHFGRVLVHQDNRKDGLGRKIVQETINMIQKNFPEKPIVIGAQEYLQAFMSRLDSRQSQMCIWKMIFHIST